MENMLLVASLYDSDTVFYIGINNKIQNNDDKYESLRFFMIESLSVINIYKNMDDENSYDIEMQFTLSGHNKNKVVQMFHSIYNIDVTSKTYYSNYPNLVTIKARQRINLAKENYAPHYIEYTINGTLEYSTCSFGIENSYSENIIKFTLYDCKVNKEQTDDISAGVQIFREAEMKLRKAMNDLYARSFYKMVAQRYFFKLKEEFEDMQKRGTLLSNVPSKDLLCQIIGTMVRVAEENDINLFGKENTDNE